MKFRLEIQAEDRGCTERAELERLQHGGGGMGLQQPGERIQPGTFVINIVYVETPIRTVTCTSCHRVREHP